MKKITIFLTMVFLIAINSCEKTEPESEPIAPQPKEVQEFLDSEDFKKNECFFESYGQISIGKVERFQILGDSAYQLMIPILDWFNKGVITAYLQVIELPEDELPDKGVYFMNLIDLKEGFDNSTITGDVVMLGINYNAFQHSELTVKNNIIVFSEFHPTPEKYLEPEQPTKSRLRDFLACYGRTRDSFNDDDVLRFTCDVIDIVAPGCMMAAVYICIR